jgi:hypothetical protein
VSYGSLSIFAESSRLLVLLVLIALVVLCVVFWKRLGRGALFAILGFAALLIGNLLSMILTIVLPRVTAGADYRTALAAEYVVTAVLDLAGLALLGATLFVLTVRRQPAPQPPAPYYGTQPNAPQPGPAAPPPPPPAQPGPEGPTPLWPGTPPN